MEPRGKKVSEPGSPQNPNPSEAAGRRQSKVDAVLDMLTDPPSNPKDEDVKRMDDVWKLTGKHLSGSHLGSEFKEAHEIYSRNASQASRGSKSSNPNQNIPEPKRGFEHGKKSVVKLEHVQTGREIPWQNDSVSTGPLLAPKASGPPIWSDPSLTTDENFVEATPPEPVIVVAVSEALGGVSPEDVPSRGRRLTETADSRPRTPNGPVLRDADDDEKLPPGPDQLPQPKKSWWSRKTQKPKSAHKRASSLLSRSPEKDPVSTDGYLGENVLVDFDSRRLSTRRHSLDESRMSASVRKGRWSTDSSVELAADDLDLYQYGRVARKSKDDTSGERLNQTWPGRPSETGLAPKREASALGPAALELGMTSPHGQILPEQSRQSSWNKVRGMLGVENEEPPPEFHLSRKAERENLRSQSSQNLIDHSPNRSSDDEDVLDHVMNKASRVHRLMAKKRASNLKPRTIEQLEQLAHELLPEQVEKKHPRTDEQIRQHQMAYEHTQELGFGRFWAQRLEAFFDKLVDLTATFASGLKKLAKEERKQFEDAVKWHKGPNWRYDAELLEALPTPHLDAVDALSGHVDKIWRDLLLSDLKTQLEVPKGVDLIYEKMRQQEGEIWRLRDSSSALLGRANRLISRLFKITPANSKMTASRMKSTQGASRFGNYLAKPYSEERIRRVVRTKQKEELNKIQDSYLLMIKHHNEERADFYNRRIDPLLTELKGATEAMSPKIQKFNSLANEELQKFTLGFGLDYEMKKMTFNARPLQPPKNSPKKHDSGHGLRRGRLLKQPTVTKLATNSFPPLKNRLACSPKTIQAQLEKIKPSTFLRGLTKYKLTGGAGLGLEKLSITLGDIYADPGLLSQLKAYMEDQVCNEHLEFLQNVDAFLIDGETSGAWERERASLIFHKYIRAGAEKEVNINNQTRKRITKYSAEDFSGVAAMGLDIRTVFEDAYYEISDLVESDTVKSFVRSARFKKWVDSKIEKMLHGSPQKGAYNLQRRRGPTPRKSGQMRRTSRSRTGRPLSVALTSFARTALGGGGGGRPPGNSRTQSGGGAQTKPNNRTLNRRKQWIQTVGLGTNV